MSISYQNNLDSIQPQHLTGFFEGWPNPPTPETHLRILDQSDHVVLAVDEVSQRVVGFVTAISDGVLSAYIPLLEVLKPFQRQGIGSELIARILKELGAIYMIDLLCDRELEGFYERLGMNAASGMSIRNYNSQSGLES